MHTAFTSRDLFYFVRRGNIQRVLQILYFQPSLVHTKNVWGHDPLYYANLSGDPTLIQAIKGRLKPKSRPPHNRKGLPSLVEDVPQSMDNYLLDADDFEDDYPAAEIQAEAELEENLALLASMFPALSLSTIEVILKRSHNDVQAGIEFLLAEDAQKPGRQEEPSALPLGSEQEFPALPPPAAGGRLSKPAYQKPLKENLLLLPQAEKVQEPAMAPRDEDDLASWQSSGEGGGGGGEGEAEAEGEEDQWVNIEDQVPVGQEEELDFEDNVSFAESSGQEWDVVSQSSGYSFQFEPSEEAAIEIREESGKSNRILDAEVEAQPSFAEVLKQNLSRNHVPLRPTTKSLLPKSTFGTDPAGLGLKASEDSFEGDEAIAKDPFRAFGRQQKPRNGGKSQSFKPKNKGGKGKGKQSRNIM